MSLRYLNLEDKKGKKVMLDEFEARREHAADLLFEVIAWCVGLGVVIFLVLFAAYS